MLHLDLFSGIGGFALAADWIWGKENIEHIFCDNEPFAQAILKKHWPEAPIFGDIRTLTREAIELGWLTTDTESARRAREREMGKDGENISSERRQDKTLEYHQEERERGFRVSNSPYLITGGFPCQPFSQAGRRKGTADDRYLWPEMLRLIHETKPRWVVGENVAGFITWSDGLVFRQVLADLESEGYEVQAFVIPAVAVNAPHRRDRVWIVGHHDSDAGHGTRRSEQEQQQTQRAEVHDRGDADSDDSNSEREGRTGSGDKDTGRPRQFDRYGSDKRRDWNQNWLEVAARLCTLDDGISGNVVRPRGWRNAALKGAGNAIVPQVVAEIFKVIKEIDGNF